MESSLAIFGFNVLQREEEV